MKDLRLVIIKATAELVSTKKELAKAQARIEELEFEKSKITAIDVPSDNSHRLVGTGNV